MGRLSTNNGHFEEATAECPTLPAASPRVRIFRVMTNARRVAQGKSFDQPPVAFPASPVDVRTYWDATANRMKLSCGKVKYCLLFRRNRIIKRCVDYLFGIPLFLISLPILGLCMIWIKVASPGQALFSQEREGAGGRMIRIWKLRTMHPEAESVLHCHLESNPAAQEEWRQFCKLKNDPRIIPGIGRLLRKTSLDELPQLWNVLLGNMSLVGPRPLPMYHLNKFTREFRRSRRRLLPGLTGMWQVMARSDGDLNLQKRLDSYYIRNWSFWLDLYLLARTIPVVVSGKGAY